VSLGLSTTELVINALKHAFPGDRAGRIVVSSDVERAGWTLSVSDNGVGRTDDYQAGARPGFGTSIIEALAHQLDARVEIAGGPGGTMVSIVHTA
jgi:two-component sensor histidine kinase